MFSNEVLIEKNDKERLVELLTEANAILEKYPYEACGGFYTVTNMSSTKLYVKKAKEWCNYLHIK